MWTWAILPILKLPALPAFLIAGTFFLWLGRRIGSRADVGFIGARAPRRRRPRKRTVLKDSDVLQKRTHEGKGGGVGPKVVQSA